MKLGVGMYVRTEKGEITKIEKLTLPEEPSDCLFVKFENESYSFKYKPWETIDFKASHNVIDLIKGGDYVNGVQVIDKEIDNLNEKYLQCGVGDYVICTYNSNEIEDVVTKEQFEAMKYRLGG